MKSIVVLLVGALLLGSAACADHVVGTDDVETAVSAPVFKKPPPVPQDPDEWPVTVTLTDRFGDQIRSDAELRPDLTDFSYVDGECGVMANIGNLDDARFDPDWTYKRKDARTCGDARVLVFEFDDGRPDRHFGAFMNADALCALGVGDVSTSTRIQFNVCTTLVYAAVRAERTSAGTWRVTADGTAADAFCSGDGGSWHNMPFEVTITAHASDPATVCPIE